jgi:hypothetical protein
VGGIPGAPGAAPVTCSGVLTGLSAESQSAGRGS